MGKTTVQGHPEGLQTEVTLAIVGTLKNPLKTSWNQRAAEKNLEEKMVAEKNDQVKSISKIQFQAQPQKKLRCHQRNRNRITVTWAESQGS